MTQEKILGCRIKGTLRIRDGLPILDPDGSGSVSGALLVFKPEHVAEAYQCISAIEPDKHYRWHDALVNGNPVNVLAGRSPRKGSVEWEHREWDGKQDHCSLPAESPARFEVYMRRMRMIV